MHILPNIHISGVTHKSMEILIFMQKYSKGDIQSEYITGRHLWQNGSMLEGGFLFCFSVIDLPDRLREFLEDLCGKEYIMFDYGAK